MHRVSRVSPKFGKIARTCGSVYSPYPVGPIKPWGETASVAATETKKPVYPQKLMYPAFVTPARSARGTARISEIPPRGSDCLLRLWSIRAQVLGGLPVVALRGCRDGGGGFLAGDSAGIPGGAVTRSCRTPEVTWRTTR